MQTDQNKLTVTIRSAVVEAIDAHFAAERARADKSRADTRKARKKGIKEPGAGWIEKYDLTVEHIGTIYGRDAHVKLNGVDRWYDVYQNAVRPSKARYGGKLTQKPQWRIRLHQKDSQGNWNDQVLWELDTEDFESAVQNCIVALLGHAYYDGE